MLSDNHYSYDHHLTDIDVAYLEHRLMLFTDEHYEILDLRFKQFAGIVDEEKYKNHLINRGYMSCLAFSTFAKKEKQVRCFVSENRLTKNEWAFILQNFKSDTLKQLNQLCFDLKETQFDYIKCYIDLREFVKKQDDLKINSVLYSNSFWFKNEVNVFLKTLDR